MRKLNAEQVRDLITDRVAGLSRNDLATKYGLSLAGVKSVLLRNSVTVPTEQRQAAAYKAKLDKNPNAMADMRKTLTADVVEKRSKAIAERYASDQQLRNLKGRQSKHWWANFGPESKYTWSDLSVALAPLGLSLVTERVGPLDSDTALVKCHCGIVWHSRCFDLLYGKIASCGCVKSKPQAELTAWLQGLGFVVEPNNRQIIAPFELDIVLPEQKLAIEYCGLAWHGESRKELRSYHLNKLQLAEAAGYRLVTIFADEWLTHREAVECYVKAILGFSGQRIGARETTLAGVTWSDAKKFMDRWHIQGAGAPQSINYGLWHDSELVAVATFKATNLQRRGYAAGGVFELVRYCVRGGAYVSGGFDKILSAFKKDHGFKLLFTYSDRRWSQGRIYLKSGFRLASTTPPSYWYFKKNTDGPRYHKSKFRKSTIGAKPSETEWEVMKNNGYDRIWDCGLQKWVLDET